MKESPRYVKNVEWSDEHVCYVDKSPRPVKNGVDWAALRDTAHESAIRTARTRFVFISHSVCRNVVGRRREPAYRYGFDPRRRPRQPRAAMRASAAALGSGMIFTTKAS